MQVFLALTLLISPQVLPEPGPLARQADPGHCAVSLNGTTNPHDVVSAFVLPEGVVRIESVGEGCGFGVVSFDSGQLSRDPDGWEWTAPETPGHYRGTLDLPAFGAAIVINVFVMVRASEIEDGHLNGYVIGEYPEPLEGREELYRAPAGFVEVTPDNEAVRISPHFTLGQFLCKQESDFPKYVVLQESLLLSLEAILASVNDAGLDAPTLFVMSGYRTPVYNRAIGNVPHSRHVFGDAADIFIDHRPSDGVMDDLDGNGRIDDGDTAVLASLVERALGALSEELDPELVGGLAEYPANEVHGPFVHVDLRGYRARW